MIIALESSDNGNDSISRIVEAGNDAVPAAWIVEENGDIIFLANLKLIVTSTNSINSKTITENYVEEG